jgi:hypothetical protein
MKCAVVLLVGFLIGCITCSLLANNKLNSKKTPFKREIDKTHA